MVGSLDASLLSLQEYTLTGLKTYTQYLVSLRVFNPEGDGPETIVVVMTDEGGEFGVGVTKRPHFAIKTASLVRVRLFPYYERR